MAAVKSPNCEMCGQKLEAFYRFRGVTLCEDCLGMAASLDVVGKGWLEALKQREIPCPDCNKPILALFYPSGSWAGRCLSCKKDWKAVG